MKPRMLNVKNTLMAFVTPIRQARYDNLGEFNAEITRRVLAERKKTPTQKYSNVGGWHSDRQLLQKLGEPFGSQLARMFIENVAATLETIVEITQPLPEKHSVEAWANVNEKGDTNAAHIHAGCPWSGVYYVSTDENAGGEIMFADPRTEALMVNHPLNPFQATNNIMVAPVPGMMLIFPSFIYHSVHPYMGNVPRISIAFNLQ